jgi:spermidine synthase
MSGKAPSELVALQAASLFSGAAALVAETLWARSFCSIVGATVEATAATFAAFLVGLALGAYVAGRWADRLANPLRAYVIVEFAIAVASAGTGLALFQLRDLLIIGGSLVGPQRAIVVFSAVLGLISIPTILMGATFPIMVASIRRVGAPMAAVSRLYTLNTLGAASGTLLCGFAAIGLLGVQGSVLFGACFNVVAAAVCILMVRKTGALISPAASGLVPESSGADQAPIPDWVMLAVALSSGVMTLAVEVIWTRLSSFFLGNRTYAFSTLVACVLLLLSVGSRLAEKLVVAARQLLPQVLGAMLLAVASCTLFCGWLADRWIHHQSWLDGRLAAGPLFAVWQVMKTLFLLAPMLIPMGCLFPLSLTAARLSSVKSGKAAGLFYLVNTAGAVVGSLLVGFWSLSEVGTFGSIGALVAFASVVASLVFIATVPSRWAKLAGLLGATAVFSSIYWVLPEQLTVLGERQELLFRKEDAYGVFQVVRLPDSTLMVSENRTVLVYYLGALSTSYVQQMQGHLGIFFNPDAKRALVLGSGYGITAGALGTYPQLERVDAVEIVPAMVEAADLFMPFNLSYHRNPRVRTIVDDGRHFLANSRDRYDIISINVSDPRIPGSSAFFHRDFYELAKQHLTPSGVVLQHAFGTELHAVMSTLASSFKNLQMFPAYNNGYNVVASDHALSADPSAIARLTGIPATRAALESIGVLTPFDPARVYSHGLVPSDVPALFAETRIASDDHPLIEFSRRGDARSLFASNE